MSGFETLMDGECLSSREPARVMSSLTRQRVRQSRGFIQTLALELRLKERQAVQISSS
jgi:hypothetical protein